jgi:hypothetical protein
MMNRRVAAGLVAFAVGMGLCGCSGGAAPVKLIEAKGTVTYRGEPLSLCSIRLIPLKEGPSSSGVTNEQGEFTLVSQDGKPGVVPGTHRVLIVDVSEQAYLDDPLNPNDRPKKAIARKLKLPPEWATPQSPLTVEVSGNTPIVLNLE